jgi:hypothetical protein
MTMPTLAPKIYGRARISNPPGKNEQQFVQECLGHDLLKKAISLSIAPSALTFSDIKFTVEEKGDDYWGHDMTFITASWHPNLSRPIEHVGGMFGGWLRVYPDFQMHRVIPIFCPPVYLPIDAVPLAISGDYVEYRIRGINIATGNWVAEESC